MTTEREFADQHDELSDEADATAALHAQLDTLKADKTAALQAQAAQAQQAQAAAVEMAKAEARAEVDSELKDARAQLGEVTQKLDEALIELDSLKKSKLPGQRVQLA